MHLEQKIAAFTKLGLFLKQFEANSVNKTNYTSDIESFKSGFRHQIKLAQEHNGWFTTPNIEFCLSSWSEALSEDNIRHWISQYHFYTIDIQTVAIIMAGNIPLVGFHDFLSVLISGHNVIVKQSSNDKYLLPFLAKYLEHIEPLFKGKIKFTEGQLTHFDAVIATGSNNTARYFEYYFKGKPSIIRKNRNSIAVLTGRETKAELEELSNDVFRYYGLGCRNVSKIFVPEGYNFDDVFMGVYHWHSIINDHKYANNYDYNKAVYLMSEFDFLENGFLMLKEDISYPSPIATVFYERYDDIEQLKEKIAADESKIQCVVARGFCKNDIPFGQTQRPQLWDYADNVDIVDFLLKI